MSGDTRDRLHGTPALGVAQMESLLHVLSHEGRLYAIWRNYETDRLKVVDEEGLVREIDGLTLEELRRAVEDLGGDS